MQYFGMRRCKSYPNFWIDTANSVKEIGESASSYLWFVYLSVGSNKK